LSFLRPNLFIGLPPGHYFDDPFNHRQKKLERRVVVVAVVHVLWYFKKEIDKNNSFASFKNYERQNRFLENWSLFEL